ncbi:hypothetical protein BMS3Bbin15_00491 [archaeon BMS3Bbin15]|nr:hypothetical protein BMS3Bbin15_00491 [archaeon BMS3Bbin15]
MRIWEDPNTYEVYITKIITKIISLLVGMGIEGEKDVEKYEI